MTTREVAAFVFDEGKIKTTTKPSTIKKKKKKTTLIKRSTTQDAGKGMT